MNQRSHPPPGIYQGVSREDYDAVEWVSNSGLHSLLCPEKIDKLSERRMLLGSALHMWWAEPDQFKKMIRAMPWIGDKLPHRATKEFKDPWADYQKAVVAGYKDDKSKLFIIDCVEADCLRNMMASLKADADIELLRNGPGGFEVMVIWRDRHSGVMCKGLIDKLSSGDSMPTIAVDLKSSAHTTPGDFSDMSVANPAFGYTNQAAMYLDGLSANEVIAEFEWVVVSKRGPDNRVWRQSIAAEELIWGRSSYKTMLRVFKSSFLDHPAVTEGAKYE